MQVGSDDEKSKPAKSVTVSLLSTDDGLHVSLNEITLAGSHAPPIPERPTRQLRNHRQPTAPLADNPPTIATAKTSIAIVPEPQAMDTAETAIPTLTFGGPSTMASQQFGYGTQIIQYGRDEYEWQRDFGSAGYMEVLAETNQGEKLITTPYLKRLGLSFNTHYQLIICARCAEGLPLSYIHTHLSNLATQRTNKNLRGEWTKSKVVYEFIHPWPISKLPTSKGMQNEIFASLHAAGFTARDAGIDCNFGAAPTPAWAQIPLPEIPVKDKLLERPQVLGLRVFDNVLHCKKCGMIVNTKSSMASHMSKHHRGSQAAKHTKLVYAQTLCEVPGWTTMFEVSKLPTSLKSEKQIEANNDDLDRSATLALLRQKKAAVLKGIEIVPDKEVRTVPPVFMRTGIDHFLSPFNRMALQETFMPDRTDPEYLDLRNALLPLFVNQVDLMKTAPTHHSTYTNITNCTP
jgi:hypothetical protein